MTQSQSDRATELSGLIEGTYEDRFAPLIAFLGAQLASGYDLGLSVTVDLGGRTLVDVWGGHTDEAQTAPWEPDTITNVWSTTKTMTALSALVLADRGGLDLDAPVARYWPEFGVNGKDAITVKQLMSHTSGVSGWEQPVDVDDLFDWDIATAKLAAQAPWWEPGTASGYHALNQGHLVGEVIRRIDGRPLAQFFAEEIAGPLDADFSIGVAEKDDHRIANVVPPPPLPIDPAAFDPDSPAVKTFTGPAPDASVAWSTRWRRADIGAANGHGNARSVARIQSVVANGGELDGVRLLRPSTIDRIFESQSNGVDLVLGVPVEFGIGYALRADSPSFAGIPPQGVCFWGGWGGSVVVVDVARRLTIAYMMNKMQGGLVGNETAALVINGVYAALEA